MAKGGTVPGEKRPVNPRLSPALTGEALQESCAVHLGSAIFLVLNGAAAGGQGDSAAMGTRGHVRGHVRGHERIGRIVRIADTAHALRGCSRRRFATGWNR